MGGETERRMSIDPNLIHSMEAAVASSPADQALRLHLASLQLQAGRPQAALDNCISVLTLAPNHPQALGLAKTAAETAGEFELSTMYEERLQMLAGNSEDSSVDEMFREMVEKFQPEPTPVPLTTSTDYLGDFANAEPPRITLADVGGMDEVKKRLNAAFLAPLRHPELRKLYGKSLRGGLLLYGPPGCGKTFIARAVAGELGASFFSVGLSDVLEMWLGTSERNLHQIFERARKAAPCVLFLDEVDALGHKRSQLRYSAGRGVVNQLLLEMDGASSNNAGVFVLAASNHPWDIDGALRRPGRLDRSLLVLPPDKAAREAILRYHLCHRPLQSIYFGEVAAMTDGFSGADLVLVCETATEYAFEDSVAKGKARPITMRDLALAIQEVRPSTKSWFELARQYARYSNNSGEYDELLPYLPEAS
jgi:SpoVK/Ycf46/Vps4 family AAA+-type ATPase